MRAGFSLRLKPEGLPEYKRRHDEIWPELVDELARNGIQQITIFVTGSTLFIYSEVNDQDTWQTLWHTDIHMRWAKELEPYMELDADGAPLSTDLTEVFHIRPSEAAVAG